MRRFRIRQIAALLQLPVLILCTNAVLAQEEGASEPESFAVKRDRFHLQPESGFGSQVANYPVPEGFPPYESRTRYIGNLRGTWYEMGVQYGNRAGDLINSVVDYMLLVSLDAYGEPHLKEDLARQAKAIQDYSPQMIEFMNGIADGASVNFAEETRYPGVLSDFERIVMANALPETIWTHPGEEFHHGKHTPVADPAAVRRMLGEDEEPGEDEVDVGRRMCTGMILSGNDSGLLMSATSDGETYLTQNMDAEYAPWTWNVAYVATPSDLDASVYWSINTAGMVGGNNTLVNWEGLGISHYYGGLSDDPIDHGVPFSPLLTHAAAYSKNVDDAIEMLTVGTDEYRQRTGRSTVLRSGPWAFNIADPESIAVIEVSSHRYCVRRPGDSDEEGNYTIYTNYYQCEHYYDENNVRVDEPMGPDGEEDSRVATGDARYYAVDWHIRHKFGEFDLDEVRKAPATSHIYEKETGRRIDFTTDENGNEIPQWQKFAWNDVMVDGGTMHASVVRLRPDGQSEIWSTKGRAAEWIGEWQHFDFIGYGK